MYTHDETLARGSLRGDERDLFEDYRQARSLGRPPTAIELAEELGLGVEAVLDARAAATARRQESLDSPPGDVEDHRAAGERVGFEEPGFDLAEDAAMLSRLLAHLDARDREVLRLYFVEDLTQTQVAARVGSTQMQISRLIRRAIAEVRAVAMAEGVA